MLEKILEKKKPTENAKCIKCGKNEPTKDDRMCDSCRFMLTIESIIVENAKLANPSETC